MKIESSTELQDISLSTLLKNVNIYSKVKDHLNEAFFENIQYKLIYKSLKYFYSKYTKLPTLQELVVVMIELHEDKYGNITEIKQLAMNLYNMEEFEPNFIIEKLTTFIRRNMIESTFKNLLPKIQNGESLAIDTIGATLADNLNIEINTRMSINLADTSNLARVREEAVGTVDQPTIIKSCIPGVNNCLTFKGYKAGDFILFVGAPGTGKTMFMVNELSNAAIQGFNVLHVFLGDMTDYDGVIRYTSRLSTVLQDEIVAMTISEQADLIQKCNYQGVFGRVECASYAANELCIDQLINEIYRIQKDRGVKFDMIAIDYPDNLRLDGANMYKDGGDTYNKLSMLARNNKSVVIAGSQPKLAYWGEEIIPKEAAAESSKKQHVVDLMITSGKPFKGSVYMTYHIAKVRRGNEGILIRVKSAFERAFLEQCSEQEYLQYKSENM